MILISSPLTSVCIYWKITSGIAPRMSTGKIPPGQYPRSFSHTYKGTEISCSSGTQFPALMSLSKGSTIRWSLLKRDQFLALLQDQSVSGKLPSRELFVVDVGVAVKKPQFPVKGTQKQESLFRGVWLVPAWVRPELMTIERKGPRIHSLLHTPNHSSVHFRLTLLQNTSL